MFFSESPALGSSPGTNTLRTEAQGARAGQELRLLSHFICEYHVFSWKLDLLLRVSDRQGSEAVQTSQDSGTPSVWFLFLHLTALRS